MNPTLTVQEALNRLAGTTGRTAQEAANIYAGTSGRTIQEALNVKAGVTGRTAQQAANILAGTTGLTKQEALNRLVFPTFLPTDISGLTLWCKADSGAYTDAGTTLATNGQTVQQWNDLSGNNNNFSQGTAGSRPTFTTDVQNGLPALVFDGVADFMNSTIGADTSRTIFVVTEGLDVGFGGRFFGLDSNSASVFDNTGVYAYYATQASGIGAIGGNSLNPAIIVLKVSSAASLTTYIDGVLGSTFDPADVVTTGTILTIGARDSSGTFPEHCHTYEVVVYDSALSDANINLVNSYLSGRWNISVSSL